MRIGEDRWARFQAANRKRYGGRAAKRPPPALARLLARAKTPGRMSLLSGSGVWEPGLDVSLGSIPGPSVSLADYVRAGPDAAAQARALFDQSWYLERAPLLAGSRWPPLAHYLIIGDSHNLSPHPLVDGPAYRARHGAKMSVGRLTALETFPLFEGAAEGANPHALFDVRHYVGQSEDVAASGENLADPLSAHGLAARAGAAPAVRRRLVPGPPRPCAGRRDRAPAALRDRRRGRGPRPAPAVRSRLPPTVSPGGPEGRPAQPLPGRRRPRAGRPRRRTSTRPTTWSRRATGRWPGPTRCSTT